MHSWLFPRVTNDNKNNNNNHNDMKLMCCDENTLLYIHSHSHTHTPTYLHTHTHTQCRKARKPHTIAKKLAPFNPRATPIAHRTQSLPNGWGWQQHRGGIDQRSKSGNHRHWLLQELRARCQSAKLEYAARK